jgi:hypothetical protein
VLSANPIGCSFARSRPIQPCRATPLGSCRPLPCKTSRHAPSRPSSARCTATRSGLPRGLARRKLFAFLLPRFARRRSWVFTGPSQVCSRGWVSPLHFWRSGPRVAWHAHAIAPRFIFVGGDSRLEEQSPATAVAFDFWALTPICDPHPPAATARRAILPWALPLAGFAGRVTAYSNGLDPVSNHRSPESHGPHG